ncbi:hypothetical protein [Paractinoplanes durhamensis]|uniref:hypothetical protein n=1 Tax=Paractinoplanes durhamensis TaxID=113563 RepID=UPI001942C7AC|nr:hypothetical protein [Actinoplanes durhamensis]
MPPHIQGAERRRSRWGLRLLVVGGLAGAAWLLSGAAAHAADRADEPSGSLLGAIVGGDVTAPVSGLLTAAAQPLETVPAHKHHVVADVLEVPQRVLTLPAEAVDEVAHGGTGTTVDSALGGVGTVLRAVTEPLRLTGGSAPDQQRLIAAVPDSVDTEEDGPLLAPVTAHAVPVPVAQPHRARTTKTLRTPAVALRSGAAVRHIKVTSAPIAHRHHQAAAHAVAGGPETVREGTPGGDGPAAPPQLHLGDVSGTSTSGSGTPTEGGSAAFLPAAIANSTTAYQLLPIASDVEVRRHDAEAPTVSPD